MKEQQSGLTIYKLFATAGIVVSAVGLIVLVFWSDDFLVQGLIFMTLGLIYLVWAALCKHRLITFRENLELYKMIQQVREDK